MKHEQPKFRGGKMKKTAMLLALLTLFAIAWGADDVTTGQMPREGNGVHAVGRPAPTSRWVPAYSFIMDEALLPNYYDYMIGGYADNPIQVQANDNAYYVFQMKTSATTNRKVFISYLTPTDVTEPFLLNSDGLLAGFGQCDIDPISQDGLFAWHEDADNDGETEVLFNFDEYAMFGTPGFLADPFTLFDGQTLYDQGLTRYPNDQYIWPSVYVSKAPSYNTDGKRRVYVCGRNFQSHSPADNPAENVMIRYADFDNDDLDSWSLASLDWHTITFPLLDDYNDSLPWGRFTSSFAIGENGEIAMTGQFAGDELTHEGLDWMVFYNSNYAEGEWTIYQVNANSGTVTIPNDEFGDPIIDADPGSCYFSVFASSHVSAKFDALGRLHCIGAQSLYGVQDGNNVYWPNMSFVKDFIFEPSTGQIFIQDVYPQSTNENPTYPYLPWDANQDGQVDQFTEDGFAVIANAFPVVWWDLGDNYVFNYCSFKMSANTDNGWLAAVWSDALKSRYYNDSANMDYSDWAEVPEIYLAISNDNGHSWSEPIRFNSIETAELSGTIPEFPNLADKIIDIGNNHGLLYLSYLDDNDYGSSIQGNGVATGGTNRVMALDIDFQAVETGDAFYGDVDENGFVQAMDAAYTLQYAVGLDPITADPRPWEDDRLTRADVDGNTSIQAYDAALILRYAVGLISSFPVEGRDSDAPTNPQYDIRMENDALVVYAGSGLYGLDLNIPAFSGNRLGTPEYPSTMLSADVIRTNEAHVALAASQPFNNLVPVLRLPITNDGRSFPLQLTVNGTTHDLVFDAQTTELTDQAMLPAGRVTGAYPNPFNPSTQIRFTLNRPAQTSVRIYNLRGELVNELQNGRLNAGEHVATWNGADANRRSAASGVYLYRVSIDGRETTGKMLMMK
jgi:hypothetical protein